MDGPHRSGCPINLSLEVFGDRWSLIVLRDVIFGGRRHFRELLTRSEEGIASNILADRLRRLAAAGMLTSAPDPAHRQRTILSLTEKSIALVPGAGAARRLGQPLPAGQPQRCRSGPGCSRPAARRSGSASWTSCAPSTSAPRRPRRPDVAEELRAAYEAELAKIRVVNAR